MNTHDLLSAWPIDGPWTIQPLTSGSNNLSYAVITVGDGYIRRIYQNTADLDRLHFEHALLTRLQGMRLPFAVPAPIPTHSGSTFVPVPDNAGKKLAALFYRIPGQQPDGRDLAQYRICGAALALLDAALSHISIPDLPSPRPASGDLGQIHPSVPDPHRMMEHLPLERTQRKQLIGTVDHLLEVLPTMYRSLPQQIVHRDFDASNVLIEGDRVTGVLDFEFAGPDLRAFDLARSLSMFTISPWSRPEGWQRVTMFAMGYREHMELTESEVGAIPDMMRLYRVLSLIHREGRRRQGLAVAEEVLSRATAILQQDEWLRHQREELAALLAGS